MRNLFLKLFSIIIAITFLGGFASVEAESSLDSLISSALDRHPDLKSMSAMVEAESARGRMSRSLMNPELTLGFMDIPSDLKYNTDPSFAFQAGVMQRLPWHGKLRAAQEASAARIETAGLSLETARQNMAAMVAMAYYELAALNEERVLLDEGLELSKEMTQAAVWMAGSGMGRLADIEKARLEEENWKLRIIANQGEIGRKQAELAYLVGGELDSTFFAQVSLPDGLPNLPNLDSLLAPEIIANAPRIRESLATSRVADKDVERVRLSWYPDFDVMLAVGIKPDLISSGGVDHNGQPLPDGRIDQMNMISLEVSFPVPLFSNGNQRAEIAEMTAMRSVAIAQAADARAKLEMEIRTLHEIWREQNDCCQFVQETLIGRAESLYNATLIDYQAGRTPFMELSQAGMSLVMAKMELSMSRAEAWGARASLWAALGILVSDIK